VEIIGYKTHGASIYVYIDEMTKSREPPRGIIQQKCVGAQTHTHPHRSALLQLARLLHQHAII